MGTNLDLENGVCEAVGFRVTVFLFQGTWGGVDFRPVSGAVPILLGGVAPRRPHERETIRGGVLGGGG